MELRLVERGELAARDVDLADAQAIREPPLHAVAAGRERDAPIGVRVLDHLGGDEASRVHEEIDTARGRAREIKSLVTPADVGQHQVAVAGEVVAEGRMLRAGGAVRGVGDRAVVGVGVGLEQRDAAVAGAIRAAQQAARQVVREVAAADQVRLLRILVGGARGQDHQALGVARALRLDLERRRLARALGAGEHARAAGVEDADAHVGGRLRQAVLQRLERQLRVAQAERAVLGVAGEIDEQRHVLAALGGVARAPLHLAERAQEVVRAAVQEQRRVLGPHAAEADQDIVDLLRVVARVQQAGACRRRRCRCPRSPRNDAAHPRAPRGRRPRRATT